jgi:hypothetical protein
MADAMTRFVRDPPPASGPILAQEAATRVLRDALSIALESRDAWSIQAARTLSTPPAA